MPDPTILDANLDRNARFYYVFDGNGNEIRNCIKADTAKGCVTIAATDPDGKILVDSSDNVVTITYKPSGGVVFRTSRDALPLQPMTDPELAHCALSFPDIGRPIAVLYDQACVLGDGDALEPHSRC